MALPDWLDLGRLMAGPELYPWQVNWAQQQVFLLSVTPEFYATAPFLDQRAVPPQRQAGIPSAWVPLAEVARAVAAQPAAARLGLVFHVGHCGSTLLSQALALNARLFSLREPLPLRDLSAQWQERHAPWSEVSADGLDARIDLLRALWARTPSSSQLAIVKASSFCCPLAGYWLKRYSNDRAVLLAVSPEIHFASMVGVPAYIGDLKATAKQRMSALVDAGGADLPALHTLSAGEIAALAYISDLVSMHDAARLAGDRVLRQDFDAFLAAPGAALAALNAFFGAPLLDRQLDTLLQDPLFSRYSKAGEFPFSAGERQARLREARSHHGAEIKRGRVWLDAFAARHATAAQALEWFDYRP